MYQCKRETESQMAAADLNTYPKWSASKVGIAEALLNEINLNALDQPVHRFTRHLQTPLASSSVRINFDSSGSVSLKLFMVCRTSARTRSLTT